MLEEKLTAEANAHLSHEGQVIGSLADTAAKVRHAIELLGEVKDG